MRLNLKVSVSDNNLVNVARKVLRLIEFTCITTGCIPPPAFLTSTAVAITTMVAWKKSKYENSPLFFDLGDQRSNISPRSQLCASQSYCKQLRQLCFERTSWSLLSPTRARRLAASKTESCFWLLSLSFYFPSSRRSNQETIQRSIPSDEWTESLILSQQIVIFLHFHTIRFSLLSMDLL